MISLSVINGKAYVWNAENISTLREEHRIVGVLAGCLPRAPKQNRFLGRPLQLLPEEATLLVEKGIAEFVNDSASACPPSAEQVEAFKKMRNESYQEQIHLCAEDVKGMRVRYKESIIEGRIKRIKRLKSKMLAAGKQEEDIDQEELEREAEKQFNQKKPPIRQEDALVQTFLETPFPPGIRAPLEWNFPCTEMEKIRYLTFKALWEQGHFLTSGGKFGGDFLVYPGDPMRYHSFYIAVCLPHRKQLGTLDIVSMGHLATKVRKTALLCSVDDSGQVLFTSLQWTGIS